MHKSNLSFSTPRYKHTRLIDQPQATTLTKTASLPKLRLPKSQTMDLNFEGITLGLIASETLRPVSKYAPSTTRNHYPSPIFDSSSYGLTSIPITSQQLVEENFLRKNKAEILLYELRNLDLMRPGQRDNREDVDLLERKRRTKIEIQKRTFSLFERILCLYQLRFDIAFGIISDSFLDIDGVNDNFDLIQAMKDLAPIISRFPYTFFRKLRIPVLTFCDDVFFHKAHGSFCENRILAKSLIPIKKLDSQQKLTDHFIQILFYHLRSSTPNFETRLSKVEQEKPKQNATIVLMRFTDNKLKIKKKLGVEKDWIILKMLILNPKEALYNKNGTVRAKASIFRSFLEELDPEGINEKWWTKLEKIPFDR